MSDLVSPPSTLRAAGKRLWRSIAEDYDLDEHEQALLLESARTVDLLNQLEQRVRADGPMVKDDKGNLRVHPAAVECRQQRIALARLLAALRMPAGAAGDHQAGARPQRRVGARGVYGIRGAVS